jgi:hypothetical protein
VAPAASTTTVPLSGRAALANAIFMRGISEFWRGAESAIANAVVSFER